MKENENGKSKSKDLYFPFYFDWLINIEEIPNKYLKAVLIDMVGIAKDGKSPREYKGITRASAREMFGVLQRSRTASENASRRYSSSSEKHDGTRVSEKSAGCNAGDIEVEGEIKGKIEVDVDVEGEVEGEVKHPKDANTPTTPPTLSEIEAYKKETGSAVDAMRFYNYYNQRQWKGVANWKIRFDSWGDNEIGKIEKEESDRKIKAKSDEGKEGIKNPPTLSEVISYAKETGSKVNPHTFHDYYTLKDWKGVTNWKETFDLT